MNLQINIFTKKRSSLIEKSLRFHIVFISLLAGKYYGKKSLRFCYVSGVDRKNILSLLAGKTYRTAQLVFSH